MAPKKTTANYSLFHDLRRFGVEALCLLMLLYGAPLQALDSITEPKSVAAEANSTQDEPSWVGPVLETAGHTLDAVQDEVRQLAVDIASQPWTDAFGLLFKATSIGASSGSSAPPSPPKDDDRPSKDYDLASLAAGFPDKNALDAVPLLPGWNQVSLPEVPASSDPATALNAIGGSYHKVYTYNGCDAADPWKVYDPNDPAASDLTTIGVEQGLLIDATAAVGLPSDGTLPDSTMIQLCTGWNLIGFPSAYPRHVKSALAPILDKLVRVYAFDPFDLADNWKFYEASAPAWASDLDTLQPGMGYWVLVTEDVQLEIKNVGDAPSIAFTSPQDLDVITAPTEIQGTVASDLLDNWQLRYRGVGENDWIELANGNYPVQGKLGDFDSTLLLNGMYELELVATDLQGQQVNESIAIVVEGNMKIGHFTLSFVDLAIPLSGLDIQVVRTYDSRQRHLQGDFGYGWSLDIRQGSYRNNRPPGDGWRIPPTEGPWGLPCSTVQELKSHLTTVRLSDQEVYRFRLTVKDPGTIIGGCIGRAEFEFVDGPVPGTTLEILGNDEVLYQNNSDELRDPNSFALFVPEDVKLTTRDGRIFHLDLADGVTHLEDLNGNTLEITPEGITHSSGRGVEFERDAEGRIERIIDPMGNANVYAYDDAGDHVSFTDRIGAVTTFAYADGHYLEDIVNALGVRAVRTEYDADGRMVRVIDAAGKVVALDHDLDARREVITNRLGFVRVMEYDGRGNVVREVDELGNASLRTFDGQDNLLSQTDPLGRTTTFGYSAFGDLVTLSDPLGRTTTVVYDNHGLPIELRDPLGNMSHYTTSANGQLVEVRDSLGHITTLSYRAQGELQLATDALGSVTQIEHNALGYPVEILDAEGHTTRFEVDGLGKKILEQRQRTLPNGSSQVLTRQVRRDPLGRPIEVIEADGAITTAVYDALGRVTSSKDAAGRETRFEYDLEGRLARQIDPAGGIQSFAYDAEGRLVTDTDRAGRTKTFLHDAVGRLLEIHMPDGSIARQSFDAAGQLLSATRPSGNTTTFQYDAAGQRSSVVDSAGFATSFSYDAVGRLASVTNGEGETVTFRYDALGRRIKIQQTDGSHFDSQFDALGRIIRETDPEGNTFQYGYDRLGRLLRVVDPLEGETTFAYDEVGNLTRQTDALTRSTHYEQDALGRRTARILPDGSRETLAYSIDGRVTSYSDFNGTTQTFVYDALGHLIQRSGDSGVLATFTYDEAGRRISATNSRGSTRWFYDAADRLVEKIEPDGRSLGYFYDIDGRVNRIEARIGTENLAISTSYDARGLPLTVTDAAGDDYTFAHDAAGRLTETVFPNGIVSQRIYDPLGRLAAVRSDDPQGQAVQHDHYSYSPAGQRIAAVELDGTRRAYTFDALDRLIEERVTASDGVLMRRSIYTYDAVGNRLSLSTEEGDAPAQIVTSSYDMRNRLVEEGGVPQTWDSNGNLLSAGEMSYRWDLDHQMIGATLPDGSEVEIETDIDGQRVGMTLRRGEHEETHRWLLDDQGPLSHVFVEEIDGKLDAVNSRAGQQLLARTSASGATSYLHGDGLGSVRLLSNATGEVTDHYSYSAFGGTIHHNGTATNPYRFAGERWNEALGLYNLRARDLDVKSGRFIGLDPFEGDPSLPASLHGYHYANLNPVDNTDPSGRFTVSQTQVVMVDTALLQGIAFGTISYAFSRGRGLSHRAAFKQALGAGGVGILLAVPYIGPALGIYFIGSFFWAALNGELDDLDYWEFAAYLVAALVLKQVSGAYLRATTPKAPEPAQLPGRVSPSTEAPRVFSAVEGGIAIPEGIQGTSPRAGDFTGLRGADPLEVLARVPADWLIGPSNKNGGVVFRDPANRSYNWIRLMPGDPASPHPISQGPYLRVFRSGYLDDAGQLQVGRRGEAGHTALSGNPTLE